MTITRRCSSCGTIPGTCICTECQSLFCPQYFNNHRHYDMTMQFTHLISKCHQFMMATKDTIQIRCVESSLLTQIDNWQKCMIEKVIQIAENTRHQVSQSIHHRKSEIIEGIKTIGQEIHTQKDIVIMILLHIHRTNLTYFLGKLH